MKEKIYEVAITGDWYGVPVFCKTESIAKAKLQETLRRFEANGFTIEEDAEHASWWAVQNGSYYHEIRIVAYDLES